MKNMLSDANANNYAVMAINCFNIETARSVIRAAEEENAPIIIKYCLYYSIMQALSKSKYQNSSCAL